MAQAKIMASLNYNSQEELKYEIKDLEHRWNNLSFKDKQHEFDHLSKNLDLLKAPSSGSSKTYLNTNSHAKKQNGEDSEYLNEYQNSFISFKAELGWESLKNESDFLGKKYFLCLPTLSKTDKAFIGRKITENNGIIRTSPTEVDYIIVNEGVFNGEEKHRRQEQIKIFTHMNSRHSQEARINQHQDISKSINFIHESNYKSRIAKLVTHAPKKIAPESVKSSENLNKNSKCPNVFNFLSNEKWKILTLNDLYDVINRQESKKGNLDWFRKRLRPMIKEYGEFNYDALFCAASFYRVTDGANREMDHIVHYDEFEPAEKNDKVDKTHLEFIKKANPLMNTFSNLKVSIPVVNLDAPQGTAIFQTFTEYQYSVKSDVRENLHKKYRESIKKLTNKVGGMGKNVKNKQREQKPSSKHSFCFLWKVEFEKYFEHVESESHKNSIYIHQKSYDQIDEMFDELYVELQENHPVFKWYESKDSTEADLSMIQKPVALQVIDQQSTVSHSGRPLEPLQKIDEPSLEQEGEDNDQQINVIVEENSNDFTNRKANEELSPVERNDNNGEYSKFTPSKDVLNSKQIVSDLKSDCDFEDESKHIRAEMIGKKHEFNTLLNKLSEEEKSEKEEAKQEEPYTPKPVNLKQSSSFGAPSKNSNSDVMMRDEQFLSHNVQNPFTNGDLPMEARPCEQKEPLKLSPHFEKSESEKNKENKSSNSRLSSPPKGNISTSNLNNHILKKSPSITITPKTSQVSQRNSQSVLSEKHLRQTKSRHPQIPYERHSDRRSSRAPSVSTPTPHPTSSRHIFHQIPSQNLRAPPKHPQTSLKSQTATHPSPKSLNKSSSRRIPIVTQRLVFGYNTFNTHRRSSKVKIRKRDQKAQNRVEEGRNDPKCIQDSIRENFQRMKKKQTQQVDRSFMMPAKSGLGSKRKRMLIGAGESKPDVRLR